MKIRIKFAKYGNLKYIGHLDIMRCFQKMMRRAKVDIRYSEGFSPHQIMSFASPLGLGLTSQGEYVDIEVLSTESSKQMIERINAVTVEGITVLDYVELPDICKTAMSQIAAADYELTFADAWTAAFVDQFEAFMSQASIMVSKQTKKQVLEYDLKPLVYSWSFDETRTIMNMQVSAGSVANLKPEQVTEAFEAYAGLEAGTLKFHNHRVEMYANLAKEGKPRKLIPLSGLGKEIL